MNGIESLKGIPAACVLAILFSGCATPQEPQPDTTSTAPTVSQSPADAPSEKPTDATGDANGKSAGLANPAATHCIEKGGKIEIVEKPEGQQGICVLSDGTRCDEWAYFRGECPCAPCRQLAPPAPTFCEGGKIVAGPTDACGCASPPKCEK